jgi:hypothetical protein
LTSPFWPSNSQPNIFEVTTVGIAQGTSMAARTMPRPRKVSCRTSAMARPSTVSSKVDAAVNWTVCFQAFQNWASLSSTT